jgi:hypothetical protein
VSSRILIDPSFMGAEQIAGDCSAKPRYRRIFSDRGGVKFLMRDGRREVPCRAALDLPTERFDSNGTPSGHKQAFLFHRVAIEEAASVMFDEGDIESGDDPKIVVTARDMASRLSRKF